MSYQSEIECSPEVKWVKRAGVNSFVPILYSLKCPRITLRFAIREAHLKISSKECAAPSSSIVFSISVEGDPQVGLVRRKQALCWTRYHPLVQCQAVLLVRSNAYCSREGLYIGESPFAVLGEGCDRILRHQLGCRDSRSVSGRCSETCKRV